MQKTRAHFKGIIRVNTMLLVRIVLFFTLSPLVLACEKPSIPFDVKIKGNIHEAELIYIVAPSDFEGWSIIRATYKYEKNSIPIQSKESAGSNYFNLTLTQKAKLESRVHISYKKEKNGNSKSSCIHDQVVDFGIWQNH